MKEWEADLEGGPERDGEIPSELGSKFYGLCTLNVCNYPRAVSVKSPC